MAWQLQHDPMRPTKKSPQKEGSQWSQWLSLLKAFYYETLIQKRTKSTSSYIHSMSAGFQTFSYFPQYFHLCGMFWFLVGNANKNYAGCSRLLTPTQRIVPIFWPQGFDWICLVLSFTFAFFLRWVWLWQAGKTTRFQPLCRRCVKIMTILRVVGFQWPTACDQDDGKNLGLISFQSHENQVWPQCRTNIDFILHSLPWILLQHLILTPQIQSQFLRLKCHLTSMAIWLVLAISLGTAIWRRFGKAEFFITVVKFTRRNPEGKE